MSKENEEMRFIILSVAGKYSSSERVEEVQEAYNDLLRGGVSYQTAAAYSPILVDIESKREAAILRKQLGYDDVSVE